MIDSVKAWCRGMERNDMMLLSSTLLTLVLWWVLVGRRKYSTKGMR